MKKLFLLLALACLGASPALAQTYSLGNQISDTNPQPVKSMCWNGSAFAACSGTGASAGQVQGNIGAASTDSGNPVKVGGIYNTTLPTLTDGQRGNLQLSPNGAATVAVGTRATSADAVSNTTTLIRAADGANAGGLGYLGIFPFAFNTSTWDRMRGDTNGLAVQPALSSTFWNYAAAASGIVNTTTAVTVKAAAGASVRNYVMAMQCSHDALGAATEFAIRDGAAGTVMWRGKMQTAATDMTGNTINFEPPLKGTANTLVEIVTLTAVTGGVYCNLQGYTGS